MPIYEWERRFGVEFKKLSKENQDAFLEAVARFVASLKAGRAPEPSLGIKEMTDHPGIFEFHYSKWGRATFHYGSEERGSNALVVWRRIGGHEIYRKP